MSNNSTKFNTLYQIICKVKKYLLYTSTTFIMIRLNRLQIRIQRRSKRNSNLVLLKITLFGWISFKSHCLLNVFGKFSMF